MSLGVATSTLIIGEPSTGKSASLRNLNPDETFMINIINKPFPFRGASKIYSRERKNYLHCDNAQKIVSCIKAINERAPNIKTIIIDDFQYIISNSYMEKSDIKGYDKFTTMAKEAFSVIDCLRTNREDLHTFVLCHSDIDDHGRVKCKTIGKLLDEKIGIEGRFPIIFISEIVNDSYKFLVQRDGDKPARTPMGMFEEKYVDNDLEAIRKVINAYYADDGCDKLENAEEVDK
jgi:hypothetical protein